MSSLTLQWLNSNTLQYPQAALLISHITPVLTTCPTLRVKTAPYTYNDGRTQLLLCLHGLLPITYRGSSYNIPIDVWFPLNYGGSTDSCPIVYVVPTSEMGIRTGRGTIESDGRVVSERYLDEWQRKAEGRDLAGLIQSLQDTFGREPPVYAKKATSTSTSTPTSATPISTPQPQASPSQDLPARPPKPVSTSPVPTIQHQPSASYVPNNRYASPAPLPQQQPQQQPRPQSSSYASPPPLPPTVVPTNPHTPINNRWSMPPPPPQPNPPQIAQQHQQQPPPPPLYPSLHALSPPPLPPQQQQQQQQALPVNAQSQPQLHPTLPSVPPPNLLDSDMPSPQITQPQQPLKPSLPPNPHTLALYTALHQKFHTSLASLSASHETAMTRLRTLQTDLLTGEPAIRDEIGRLGAVRDLCRGVCGQMGNVVKEAQQRVAWLKAKGEVGVDEVVCSSDVVWNQLIDLVAEDNALEDTIYHLHRAHNAGRIDLERFLRTARALAEEQFMKRALVDKILKLGAEEP